MLGDAAYRLAASTLWLSASVSTTVANKRLSTAPTGPLVLTLVQIVVAAAISSALTCAHACTHGMVHGRWSTVWALTVPILFMLSISSSLVALEKVPITSWLVIRNMEPAVVACLEAAVPSQRAPCSPMGAAALAGLVGGALLTQHPILCAQAVTPGVWWGIASILLGSCTRVWQSWLLDLVEAPPVALVMYNNLGGSLLLACYLLLFDRRHLATLWSPRCPRDEILLSCVPATFLTFGSLKLQTIFSASQMAVLSCVAKIILICLSFTMLHEPTDRLQQFGIALSIFSCMVYTLRKPARSRSVNDPDDEGGVEPLITRKPPT